MISVLYLCFCLSLFFILSLSVSLSLIYSFFPWSSFLSYCSLVPKGRSSAGHPCNRWGCDLLPRGGLTGGRASAGERSGVTRNADSASRRRMWRTISPRCDATDFGGYMRPSSRSNSLGEDGRVFDRSESRRGSNVRSERTSFRRDVCSRV